MKNILVVTVNWLGDAVFSTPVFKALKEEYPLARVTAMCVPRVKEVMSLCPHIDNIIVYDEDGEDRPLLQKILLIQRLKKERFDIAFILRRSLSRSLLCVFAGIPVRVGFAKPIWRSLLTHAVCEHGLQTIHRSDVYLKVIEEFGVKVNERRSFLTAEPGFVNGWKSRLLAMGLNPKERLIVVNTGGNWNLKQWPKKRFVALIKRIYELKLGRVILPGSAQDVERVKEIAHDSGVEPTVVAGETGLKCLAGLFSCTDIVVTADSGPSHLASALGVSVVALFGPTRPEVTGPRGIGSVTVIQKDVGCNQAPCYHLECQDNKCMKAIQVDDVLKAIAAIKR